MKALNDTKLVLSEHFNHLGSICYQIRSSQVPIFPKAVSWLGLFFAVYYSKPALVPLRRIKGKVMILIILDVWKVPQN